MLSFGKPGSSWTRNVKRHLRPVLKSNPRPLRPAVGLIPRNKLDNNSLHQICAIGEKAPIFAQLLGRDSSKRGQKPLFLLDVNDYKRTG